MDLQNVTAGKNILLDKNDLINFSNEELINKVLQLQAHNQQLKNIIAKKDQKDETKGIVKGKLFDFSKYHMQHIMLKILYLGWNYQGFVCQEDSLNTVEHCLMEALLKCRLIENRQTSNYHRCGRTDKGVSSFGQVISITVRSSEFEKKPLDYCKMLNRLLPEDIRVIAWCSIGEEFSARFNCNRRIYRYFFPKGNLDLKAMNEAAQYLIGTHDFRNLCKMDVGNGVMNFIRSINRVEISEIDENQRGCTGYEMCRLELEGQAFLWHQVRCIVSILFLVGQRLEKTSIIDDLLNLKVFPNKPQYPLADPVGLNLFETEYPSSVEWKFDEEELTLIVSLLQKHWAEYEIKATHLKEMLNNLQGCLSKAVVNQSSCLVKHESKIYKPLLLRNVCKSLEDKIEHYKKKRKLTIITKMED